jgi:hypothetical protein
MILAAASLGNGTGTTKVCNFAFTLDKVPDTAKFYSVEVSHRGQVTKSHDELVADGWKFSLSLGS